MGDVDAGNVKARASIEYDPSGLKQMKEDLASLGQAAGSAGESAGQASDKMAGLGESMSGSADGAKEFSAALEELPKIAESGTSAVAEMSGVLEEHRAAAEEAGAAQETFSKQVESTASSFEKAAPVIQTATEHTQKFAQSVQVASESISQSTSSWGNNASENMAVFEDSLVNPYPFQMIDQHLVETGQSWGDFTSSIGEGNTSIIRDMAQYGQKTYDVLGGMSSQMQVTGQTFTESATSAEEFTKQFNGVADSTASASKAINEFGGVGSAMYEPTEAVKSFNSAINEMGGVGDAMYGPAYTKPVTMGGAFSEVMGGVGNMLNEIAMPLMATQMIGMAVQQVGQAMYDSAAIAEGPAAHSFGTFTGTVDALGQSLQKASGQFSEGFGQELLPTLNALNDQAGGSDLAGLGHFVGGIGATIANLSLITTGVDPMGGIHGLINQGAAMLGLQQPFQGPAPVSQYQQQMNALPQTVRQNAQQLQYQSNLTMAEAIDPTWLADNNQNMASQRAAAYLIQDYNVRHPAPTMSKMIADARYNTYAAQQEQNYQYQMNNQPSWAQDIGDYWGGFFSSAGRTPPPLASPNAKGAAQSYGSQYYGQTGYGGESGGTGGGGGGGIDWGGVGNNISGFFGGIGNWFQGLFGGGEAGTPAGPVPISAGGCFVAGTSVLMADGSEKAIETLRVDEHVLAYDGQRQVPATIIGCIMFPAKQTYALTFSDGNVLVTTDSHPIATPEGWKSISPASTAQENPGLAVTQLHIGDYGVTERGTLCRLISIQKREIAPVYNITVDASHTYYAARILVHNAKQGNTIGAGSLANDGTGSQQVQVSHTFTANVQWEANNLQKQFTGVAQWAGQNLANTFMGAASWVGQNLANTFNGVANWVGQGLANTFNGVANWIGQNLANTFNGVADWVGQNLANTFNGVASWVGQGLSNTFKGVASWMGSGLEHTFNAVANWTSQNLTPNFTVNPSFTMLAEGTSNWGGGPAIVGEAGPEVVEHGGQYTMFDAGATLLNLPSGANVYPMKNLQSAGVAQFADGTGGNYTLPLNIGLKGGNNNASESVNIYLQIDGQTFWSATGVSLAQGERVTSGNRSY